MKNQITINLHKIADHIIVVGDLDEAKKQAIQEGVQESILNAVKRLKEESNCPNKIANNPNSSRAMIEPNDQG
jgi:hypothetical protein